MRSYSPFDQVISAFSEGLSEVSRLKNGAIVKKITPHPIEKTPQPHLSPEEKKQAERLMRVNHAGEVAAQALYQGQALFASSPSIRAHLLEAATEETAHLAWCRARLDALGGRASYLDPVWYSGAYILGMVAGLQGDALSLGFIAETEKQVSAHLEDHLQRLPEKDTHSRAILSSMLADEARHADEALAKGGKPLPRLVRGLMHSAGKVMKVLAYYG